jgi:hypothetical protein
LPPARVVLWLAGGGKGEVVVVVDWGRSVFFYLFFLLVDFLFGLFGVKK